TRHLLHRGASKTYRHALDNAHRSSHHIRSFRTVLLSPCNLGRCTSLGFRAVQCTDRMHVPTQVLSVLEGPRILQGTTDSMCQILSCDKTVSSQPRLPVCRIGASIVADTAVGWPPLCCN